MSNTNEIIVGLDIGTTKIACFIGQRAESGKIKILGFGKTESAGVDHGIVINVLSASDSIKKAVAEASDRANVDVHNVYVGIAGQHIRSTRTQGQVMIPPDHKYILEEDVEELNKTQYNALLKPGEEIIHVFPQCYYIDGQELSTTMPVVGVSGHELRATFQVVTGNTANLRSIRDSIELAGLTVEGVILEPVASSYAVLDDSDRNVGIALVDIGGGTTDIAIFTDNIIRYTSVLPLAGNSITNDIKESCQIQRHQAESLKTRFGNCLPQTVSDSDYISIPVHKSSNPKEISMKVLSNIIVARTKMILEQVDYEINVSDYRKQLIGGVVLTGGGSQLTNIKELSNFTICMDTRIGLPDTHLEPDTPQELINGMYSTGIGLVIYGIEEAERNRAQNASTTTSAEPAPSRPESVDEQENADTKDGADDLAAPKAPKPKGEFFKSVERYLKGMFVDKGMIDD